MENKLDPKRLEEITQRLAVLRKAAKKLFSINGIARILRYLVFFIFIPIFLDWALVTPQPVRLVFFFGGLAILVWIIIRYFIYPLSVRISDDDLAVILEDQYPHLNDRLISALQFSRLDISKWGGFNSPVLMSYVIDDAVRVSRGIDFQKIIIRKEVIARLIKAICWAGLLLIVGFLFPKYSMIGLQRWVGMNVKWPQQTYLKIVEPEEFEKEGKKVIAREDDLFIRVKASGKIPSRIKIYYTYQTGESGVERVERTPENDFTHIFSVVPGPFKFYIIGGDDMTKEYFVETLERPVIENICHFYKFPHYTGMEDTPLTRPVPGGNVKALIGTKVIVKALCNEEIESASLKIGKAPKEIIKEMKVQADEAGSEKVVVGEFKIRELISEYRIMLMAKNGLDNSKSPVRYTIRGLKDEPPMILVRKPRKRTIDVIKSAVYPFVIETRDDFGVAEVGFLYRIPTAKLETDRKKEHIKVFGPSENLPREYGANFIRSEYGFDLSKQNVSEGDEILLRFRAKDYTERNITMTDWFKFCIRSLSELHDILLRMIEGVRMRLRHIEAQQFKTYRSTRRLIDKYGKSEEITPMEKGEISSVAEDQNSITQAVEDVKLVIEDVIEQSEINRILVETQLQKLKNALARLEDILSSPTDPAGGKSPKAARAIREAGDARSAAERLSYLESAKGLQEDILAIIGHILTVLEHWVAFEEVVKIVIGISEDQKAVIEMIKKWKKE
jgi:hypothetical protein